MTLSWWPRHERVSVTLHYITSHYITLHHITSHYITLHHITSHYITLHYITLHYITLHYITLHYITLHYITLHYITLHYITLHYITLHYILLHYIQEIDPRMKKGNLPQYQTVLNNLTLKNNINNGKEKGREQLKSKTHLKSGNNSMHWLCSTNV